jgi:hypothetical protein
VFISLKNSSLEYFYDGCDQGLAKELPELKLLIKKKNIGRSGQSKQC